MNRLRTLLIVIWGSILILGGALIFWIIQSGAFNPPSAPGMEITQALPQSSELSPIPLPTLPPQETPTFGLATDTPPAATPTPTDNSTPTPPGYITSLPGNINPLTGLGVEDPSLLERRPMAVKITNYPRTVRNYQFGLTQANVVYEYYIEDGLSRFIAVFYGKDSKVGPVRSGRYFDEHVARMYHAILVFANADERVEKYLLESDLLPYLFVQRDDNCPPMCRDGRITGYNNVFLDTSGVKKFLAYRNTDNEKQSLRPTYFSTSYLAWMAEDIDTIYTFYSAYAYNYWEYDPATKLYLRYSDVVDALGDTKELYAPHIDQLNDQQVTTNNVVTLIVPHEFKTYYDRQDQVFDIQLIGSGEAYIFKSGKMFQGIWRRDEIGQPIQLFDLAGNQFGLNPGQTFYEVINPESSIRQSGNNMEFTFYIPPREFTPTPTPTKFKPTPTPKKKP